MREKRKFAERTRISKEDRTIKKYFLVFDIIMLIIPNRG